MSCSAWSIQGSAVRAARDCRASAWRRPTEKSNTASPMRQLPDQTAPSSPQVPQAKASVYVHFPYCLAKCPYCDFVSFATDRGAIDHAGYADTVLAELDRRAPWSQDAASRQCSSAAERPASGSRKSWDACWAASGRSSAAQTRSELEVTVECNPTSLDEERARALRDVGVNRLSIGVQGLDDERLKYPRSLARRQGRTYSRCGCAPRPASPGCRQISSSACPEQSAAEACTEALELVRHRPVPPVVLPADHRARNALRRARQARTPAPG